MKCALFANAQKPQAEEVLHDLSHFLHTHNVEIVVQHTSAISPDDAKRLSPILNECDLLVSIGGDGSILHLVHQINLPKAPIVGINLGSLGFLADVSIQSLFSDFEQICLKEYQTVDRLVIEGYIAEQYVDFSVNEIAIHRGCNPHLIELAVHVDGKFLNTFSSDGLIISTPIGSTAYSLSAGGPILSPDTQALVITPICPHTLSHRPLVLMPQESICIEILHGAQAVDVAFDGQPPHPLAKGQALEIRKSPKHFRLVSLKQSSYFETIRQKLGWAGSLRK